MNTQLSLSHPQLLVEGSVFTASDENLECECTAN